MYTALPRTLFVCVFASLLCTGVHAQIFVDSTGSNGFGDLPHPLAKSRFSNVDHEYNLFVRTTGIDSVRGVGIYNFLNEGVAEKYGIWNHIEQAAGATGLTFGLRNVVAHNGDADAYGVYTDLSNTSESKGRLFGNYSLIDDQGARALNKLYANFYGETVHRRKRNAYGSYLLVRSRVNGDDKASYGQYIDIRGNGTADRYGVYANIHGGPGYAGYFVGDVHVNGAITQASDERLKENIDEVEGALAKVNALRPHTYNYKPDEDLGFKEEKRVHYGFLAQEVAAVLPDLVTDVHHTFTKEAAVVDLPEAADELGFPIVDGKGPDLVGTGAKSVGEGVEDVGAADIHAVRYLDMIALLVGAVQEQSAAIEERDALLEELDRRHDELATELTTLRNTVARLTRCTPCVNDSELGIEESSNMAPNYQLYPNPASEYFLLTGPAESTGKVEVRITDAGGRVIVQRETSAAHVRFDTSDWPSGTYSVEVIDQAAGKRLSRRQVVVAR